MCAVSLCSARSMAVIARGDLDARLDLVFNVFDENGDGQISKDEYKKVVRAMFATKFMITDSAEVDRVVDAAFKIADTNNDGCV